MAQKIDGDTVDMLFGGPDGLKKRVVAFQKALKAHAATVDKAAPTEHAYIERIVKGPGQGKFEIIPTEKPVPPPEPEFVPVTKKEPELTLEEKVKKELNDLSRARKYRIKKGVTYKGHQFSGDANSIGAIMATLTASEDQPNILVRWKDAKDGYVELERSDLLVVLKLIRTLTQACFDTEFRVAQAIKSATTPVELHKAQLGVKWPE